MLNVVVQCLKLDPHLLAIYLRLLLASCLPLHTNLSKYCIKKFCRRCQSYMVSCDDPEDINVSTGNKLLSSSAVTDSELNILDSPKIHANF